MPPRGVTSDKRKRQYEHIKESERERGVGEDRAEEIAARTVNKQRAQAGEAKSTRGGREASAGRRASSRTGGSRASASDSKSSRSRSRKATAKKR